ncbi:MAG: HAD hydrolase-like protein [Woeseiaceae bacterium]|nr:HAD hydrolase-like protein [Woeseiaceae bacterium]
MRQPHSVFFDLDGTLTDPWLGISRCIEHALDSLDIERDSGDDYRWCIGPPLRESLSILAGSDLSERALSIYRERFSDLGWQENAPYDGIHAALDALAGSGSELYVATSKPRVYAIRILEHFDLLPFFTAVYGAELDGTRSDKSELLAYALSQHTVNQPVMVGDRRHDVIGAASNGMRAIGVSYGYGSVEELLAAGAEQIVDSPSGLIDVLQA